MKLWVVVTCLFSSLINRYDGSFKHTIYREEKLTSTSGTSRSLIKDPKIDTYNVFMDELQKITSVRLACDGSNVKLTDFSSAEGMEGKMLNFEGKQKALTATTDFEEEYVEGSYVDYICRPARTSNSNKPGQDKQARPARTRNSGRPSRNTPKPQPQKLTLSYTLETPKKTAFNQKRMIHEKVEDPRGTMLVEDEYFVHTINADSKQILQSIIFLYLFDRPSESKKTNRVCLGQIGFNGLRSKRHVD